MGKAKWCPSPKGYAAFDSDVDHARKKFPKTDEDLGAIKAHLAEHAGEREGLVHTQIPGHSNLWKIRWGNTSKGAGKSSGFRLIYLLRTNGDVYGVRFYDKGDREDIDRAVLKQNVATLSAAAPEATPQNASPPKPEGPGRKKKRRRK